MSVIKREECLIASHVGHKITSKKTATGMTGVNEGQSRMLQSKTTLEAKEEKRESGSKIDFR